MGSRAVTFLSILSARRLQKALVAPGPPSGTPRIVAHSLLFNHLYRLKACGGVLRFREPHLSPSNFCSFGLPHEAAAYRSTHFSDRPKLA